MLNASRRNCRRRECGYSRLHASPNSPIYRTRHGHVSATNGARGVELATCHLPEPDGLLGDAERSTGYPRPHAVSAIGISPPSPLSPAILAHLALFHERNPDLRGMLHVLAVPGCVSGYMMSLGRNRRSRPEALSMETSIDRARPSDRKWPRATTSIRLLLGGVAQGEGCMWGEQSLSEKLDIAE